MTDGEVRDRNLAADSPNLKWTSDIPYIATRRQAMDKVIDGMAFYNHRRMHSSPGCFSPRQYEKRRVAAKLNTAA